MAAAATAGEPGTTEPSPRARPHRATFRQQAGSRNRKRNWLGRLLTSFPRRDGVNVVSVVTGLRVLFGAWDSGVAGSKMSVLTSPRGKVEVVHCRRTESQDIYCIKNLIRKFTQKLFGNLNIIYLLVEDHDDLMPIFLHHDTILKETYGEYFLAELIEAQDEENHAVVCELRREASKRYFRPWKLRCASVAVDEKDISM
uniref:Cilia- and flagella-associated protein 61 N-terminal domain-containing protein n=1 Tax=Capra hircus TaxID=9925 RepID=A0A8C2NZL7_CAPHI